MNQSQYFSYLKEIHRKVIYSGSGRNRLHDSVRDLKEFEHLLSTSDLARESKQEVMRSVSTVMLDIYHLMGKPTASDIYAIKTEQSGIINSKNPQALKEVEAKMHVLSFFDEKELNTRKLIEISQWLEEGKRSFIDKQLFRFNPRYLQYFSLPEEAEYVKSSPLKNIPAPCPSLSAQIELEGATDRSMYLRAMSSLGVYRHREEAVRLGNMIASYQVSPGRSGKELSDAIKIAQRAMKSIACQQSFVNSLATSAVQPEGELKAFFASLISYMDDSVQPWMIRRLNLDDRGQWTEQGAVPHIAQMRLDALIEKNGNPSASAAVIASLLDTSSDAGDDVESAWEIIKRNEERFTCVRDALNLLVSNPNARTDQEVWKQRRLSEFVAVALSPQYAGIWDEKEERAVLGTVASHYCTQRMEAGAYADMPPGSIQYEPLVSTLVNLSYRSASELRNRVFEMTKDPEMLTKASIHGDPWVPHVVINHAPAGTPINCLHFYFSDRVSNVDGARQRLHSFFGVEPSQNNILFYGLFLNVAESYCAKLNLSEEFANQFELSKRKFRALKEESKLQRPNGMPEM